MPARSGSDAQKKLKNLFNRPFNPSLTPAEAFRMDLLHGDEAKDRAVAITCAATIEACLIIAIKSYMVPLSSDDTQRLFGPDAPLGHFSSKIKLGYALGIFGREYRADLNRIRHIRNAFAHA